MDRHILSILVENQSGVLSRVVGLVSRRGYNIESLSVGPTEDENLSRITMIVPTESESFEQLTKQLNKLVCVYKIVEMDKGDAIVRELVLIKVAVPAEKRNEVIEIANVFRAKVVDVGRTSITIEATGDEHKLAGLENLLRAYGIKEITRTGKIAMKRSAQN